MQNETLNGGFLFFLFQILTAQTKQFMISNNLLVEFFALFVL